MSGIKNNFAFFGSSLFSILVLNELTLAGFKPMLVVTSPDKPKGRGLVLTKSLVKEWAEKESIECLEPSSLNESLGDLLKERQIEFAVVASYGKIIPQSLIDSLPKGFLNVHPSLLPKYRGATPVASQILSDEKNIGVTILCIDDEIDHGPIVAQKKLTLKRFPISASKLQEILGKEGGRLLASLLPQWVEGSLDVREQNHKEATHTKKIKKADGEINLGGDPYKNFLKFCAFEDSVGIFFIKERKGKEIRVKITKASFTDGAFLPLKVTPEGGREMDYLDFKRGQ
jgi:methionyl-tRNA formyltransferase